MEIKIFGCKVNKYYTDKWMNTKYLDKKSGIFIASCVVTDKAKKKWLKFVKDNIGNLKNDEKIYLSGCGAFDKSDKLKSFYEVYPDLKQYENKIEILPEDPKQLKGIDTSLLKEKFSGIYTKKFVVIQGGCDSFCTFCLTVQKRGKHFSRTKEEILEEILEFEKNGGKEVVLTGVNLCAWGLDSTNDIGKSRFAELLEYILENTKIARIRISSLGPEFVDDKVLKVLENKRIYPHFHFSIQSGASSVLKKMARHYDGEYMRKLLEKTRNIKRDDNIDISIGADLIAGFPGETEEDFIKTYNLIKDYKITKVHAFPFSGHKIGEDVPAGIFPDQIDENIKKQRVKKLLDLGEEIRNEFIKSQKGKELEVLIEVVRGNSFKGWTQNYIEVNEDNFEIFSGNIKRNEIVIGKLK